MTPLRPVPATPGLEAAADPSVERDVDRIAGYLAGHGQPFTAIELVGFTATRDVVYRTAVCDPDELGGRGAYCTAQVCIATGATVDASAGCDTLVDETVGDGVQFDPARASAAIRRAERARAPTTRGHAEASSVVTVSTTDGSLSATAPTWFGPTRWTIVEAVPNPDTGESLGFASPAITSVRSSDDGACLAFTGTALRGARYESVVGWIRFGFATRRCR